MRYVVAEDILSGADVIAGFEQVGAETVAKCVRRTALWNAGQLGGASDCFAKAPGWM